MKLLEYQAKSIFGTYGIPIQKGFVIDSMEGFQEKLTGISLPVVIKAQVQTGGRGKAGGIKFADGPEEAQALCAKMLGIDIRGFRADEILVLEKKNVVSEFYLSIILDRPSKAPLLIFSPQGGMDIEETARSNPDKIAKIPLDPFRGAEDYVIDYALDKTGTDRRHKAGLKELTDKLFSIFYDYYTLLLEINPLAIDESGNFLAVDGKVEIDDSALPYLPQAASWLDRLQEDKLVLEAKKMNFHLVPVDEKGDVGVISNGSGMLMSSMDILSQNNLSTAAAIDLGGGATAERITEAVLLMFRSKNIDTVFICTFGGITRCDEIAKGACEAYRKHNGPKKNLVLRLEGINKEEALRIVSDSGLPLIVAEGIPNSVKAIAKLKGR